MGRMHGGRTTRRGNGVGFVSRFLRSFRRHRRYLSESGTTYVEIAIITVIVTTSLIALNRALVTANKASLVFKERTRALAIAQDKLEEVKRMGYNGLRTRVSWYVWPTLPDPLAPLSQAPTALPYPASAPLPEEDMWTPELIQSGVAVYWRHVKVKCVEEVNGVLQQKPKASDSPPGGYDTSSNLMHIEVDVTWFSRSTGKMQQVRVTGMVANTKIPTVTEGRITGTVFDEGPTVADGDDTAITGKKLVVFTKNVATGESFTDSVDTKTGAYDLYPLPIGEYVIHLAGSPAFYDSAYSASNNIVPPATVSSIIVDQLNLSHSGKDIRTRPAFRVQVFGTFTGADVGDRITIEAGDGVSSGTDFIVGQDWGAGSPTPCEPGTPCYFTIPNVAWVTQGGKTFRVTVANKTKATYGYGTICMDAANAVASPVTATDYYWGVTPPVGYGAPPCGVCAVPCQDPAPTINLSATVYASGNAEVRVRVVEYYSGAYSDLVGAYLKINDGVSATMMTGAGGAAIFGTVKPGPAALYTVSGWMATTGYMTDEWNLAFEVVDGGKYDLDPEPVDPSYSSLPPLELRHLFVLKRVSVVSGTVWKVCDGGSPPCGPASEVMAGALVTLKNVQTGWSGAVVTDADGHFVFPAVPVEASNDYELVPAGGSDMSSNPEERLVKVLANGLVIRTDFTGQPLEFVLTAVNGTIAGEVRKGGVAYQKGAVVIATTYVGTFPSVLPSTDLAGSATYSTITGTDGTYRLKVATGVGDYSVHVFSPDNPTSPVTVAVPAGQPTAGSTVAAPVVNIP